jgi:biuret amidohydrolase
MMTTITAASPIQAQPFDYAWVPGHTALVIIDMQRDFIEPGGFGASLGNDVSILQRAVPGIHTLLTLWRQHAWPVIHTRECHRPDLSDCPPSKRNRGNPSLRIGDMGPMGRVLVAGEPGAQIIDSLAPRGAEWVIDKPGKGMFWATGLHERLQAASITHLLFTGVTTEVCVQTSMREANDRGYACLIVKDATESYFPEFKRATLDMIVAQGGIVGWCAMAGAVVEAVVEAVGEAAYRRN